MCPYIASFWVGDESRDPKESSGRNVCYAGSTPYWPYMPVAQEVQRLLCLSARKYRGCPIYEKGVARGLSPLARAAPTPGPAREWWRFWG